MKNKNNKRTNEKKEQIKIKLTIFLIIFASIFAFITAYQSTKIVMTTLELSYMYAGEEVEENNPISFLNSNTYLIEGQKYNIDINITDNEQKANFSLEILLNNEQIKKIEWNDAISISTTVDISDNFHIEGENVVTVIIYKDGQIYQKAESTVSYIRKYVEQFAEKLYHKGIGTHFSFRTFGAEKMELVDALGATYIRDDMMIEAIDKGNGRYDYWNYDDWINNAKDDDISLYALLRANRTNGLLGENGKVTNNDEVTRYVKFAENVATRYPQISDFEVLNEPNGYYTSEEDAYWYTELLKKTAETLKNLNNDYKIWAGATMTVDPRNDTRMTSIEFFNRIFKNGAYKYTNCFSYHIYDSEPNSKNQWFKNKLQEHRQLFNEQGGFVNVSISEFGVTTYSNKITEDEKADRIIKQYILLDNYHIENSLLYNFRDTGTNIDNRESNFGIVSYTFTPKPAYYAMKNYYQNTNGSEYIGTINLAEGLETHVYNKDGKPKIITWATDNTKNVTIPYENFTVTDLYGDAIQSVDGKLTITSSPVYIDNISTSYYYKAISNTALEKYSEFEEKFKDELTKVPTIQTNIMVQKTYMQNLANQTGVTQDIAIQEMKKHYDIGTQLIKAYNQKQLNIEYVKLSSMLDMLDEIGNSYEDLVTISATTRNADLQTTNNNIQETEKLIENNQNLEIIYPEKILMFSKDYYDKAEYINSLEKENPIKTGLIVSKNLHSELLASWAKDFANIYIQKYMEEHKPTITYSITNMTNKDVIATLNSDIDIKVTNNDGNKTYTFTQNGSFTFRYMVNDIEYEITATVNNIDKTLPVISGVQNGQTYYTEQKIAPKATDQNLQNVDLYLNNVKVDYQNGQVIQVEGIYRLVATDKAGNSVTVQFQVMKKPESKYKIENNSIKGIQYNTTKDQFDKNVGLTESYTITRNSSSLKQTDIIASGDILTTKSGKKYTLIVAGDLTKDGKVTVDDFTRMRLYLLGLRKLDDVEKMSADANCDGEKISIDDYIRIRILILQQLSWK